MICQHSKEILKASFGVHLIKANRQRLLFADFFMKKFFVLIRETGWGVGSYANVAHYLS